MNNRDQTLNARINQVRNHWKRLILLKGSSITLIGTIAVLLTAFLLDSFLKLSGSPRFFFLVAIVTVFVISFFWTIVRPLLNIPTETQLARLIEEKHPDLEDRLVTAVELGGSNDPRVSSRLLLKLLDDACFHVQPLNLSKTLHKKGTFAWSSFALAFTLFLTVWVSTNLESFALKTDRIFSPWKFQNVAMLPKFEVTPGNSRIPKGSAQEIRAEISGFEPEKVVLYYSTGDSSWNKTDMDITAENGLFVYSFFDIENETRYYVKADDKLSDIFTFTVYDAPVIKRVDLTYNYPQYTGLKTREEIDTGDIWAPEGTQVKISAITDKPLINAEVVLGDDASLSSKILADTVITASFKVTQDSYYKIRITDTDGLTNDPPSEYYIHALPDQPPVLTIDRPGRDVKASMLEEVSISVKVQDDYGLPALKLFYTINGSDERDVDLKVARTLTDRQTGEVNQLHEFTAEYLFYLEDFHVQPGDFLTYHVQAGDNPSAMNPEIVTSEIYFVSVRTFDQEFFRPMSQGGGQNGGASSLGGRLSETQKEIIVATWKLQQRSKNLSQEDLARDLDIIVESQTNLQEVTESTLMQMQQRSLFTRESKGKAPKLYTEAIAAMNKALDKLNDSKLKEGLVHEREAFQRLLKAEAQLKRVQMQRAQAQGAGSQAAMDELARLFDDEMDKLPNKYETLRQSQEQQQNQETNEALRKIKELARRQQQLNRQAHDLARNDVPPEEKKRRIEELRRKQEEIRRQTQQLTRQMQRQGNSQQAQNDLRRATQEMRNASNNLRKDNTEIAAAKGGRALNNLKRIEDMLQRNQKESLRRQIEDIERQFQQMADAQESLTKKIDQLKNQSQPDAGESQEAEKKQARLKENLKKSQDHLTSVLRHARENKRELSGEINKLSQEIGKAKLDQKMQTAENLLRKKQFNSASEAGRDIRKNLEKLKEKLANLGGAFAETDEEKLDLALNQTRRLRENLEALRKRAQEELRKGENKDSGDQLQGAKSQERRAGTGETKGREQQGDPRKLDWLNEQVAKNLRDLQRIQNSVRVDSSLSKNFRQLSRDMQGVVRTFKGGLPERFQLIENLVLDPLKTFEADLAHKLETMKNREKLFLAREDKIPAEYQEMVEKYYEALSKTRRKQ